MKMIWCGLKIEENHRVLVNQLHGNSRYKTLCFRKIRYVFMDVKWCFNASWGLKGLKARRCRVRPNIYSISGRHRAFDIWLFYSISPFVNTIEEKLLSKLLTYVLLIRLGGKSSIDQLLCRVANEKFQVHRFEINGHRGKNVNLLTEEDFCYSFLTLKYMFF